jgi:hypothetical protein
VPRSSGAQSRNSGRESRKAARKATREARGTRSALENQRGIIQAARSRDRVFLDPVPPAGCRGNVEHYYHFLFDLLLPIHLLIRKGLEARLQVAPFGPYTERVEQFFPGRVEVAERTDESVPRLDLVGLNPRCVNLEAEDLRSFARHARSLFSIQPGDHASAVLLIERLAPDPYFMTEARVPGSGTSRRSILNHAALARGMEARTNSPLRFRNLQLETMTLADQVARFSDARAVIGQHGAGLANCIWMRPGSLVIELSPDPCMDHFESLCRVMGLKFHRYPIRGEHAVIDVDHLGDWLWGMGLFEPEVPGN